MQMQMQMQMGAATAGRRGHVLATLASTTRGEMWWSGDDEGGRGRRMDDVRRVG